MKPSGKNQKISSHAEQSQAFVDAARSFGCDESEERFDAALKKVAAHKPAASVKKGKPENQR